MNEERWILARLVRRLKQESEEYEKTSGYNYSWHYEEICSIIEELRAEATLGDEKEYPTSYTLQDTFEKYWSEMGERKEENA